MLLHPTGWAAKTKAARLVETADHFGDSEHDQADGCQGSKDAVDSPIKHEGLGLRWRSDPSSPPVLPEGSSEIPFCLPLPRRCRRRFRHPYPRRRRPPCDGGNRRDLARAGPSVARGIRAESFLAGTGSCRIEVEGVDELYESVDALSIVHPNAPLADERPGMAGVRREHS